MALQRKLRALGYPNAETFKPTDEGPFRNLVVSLEDTKIRFYAEDERAALRNTENRKWSTAFVKYLEDMECPHMAHADSKDLQSRLIVVDWLLGRAIALEYSDDAAVYNQAQTQQTATSLGVDANSDTATALIKELATLLKLPVVEDVDLQWRGVTSTLLERFTPAAVTYAIQHPQEKHERMSLATLPLGFDTGDVTLNTAAKILRLLHIHELRDLQTSVNQMLAGVQDLVIRDKLVN
eukprot:m.359692 g.359692  ORF g.359692 m.359692 type:complete len:238 (+) comp18673_c0_seq1:139-852(+)